MKRNKSNDWFAVHTYSRCQALEDGVLIDVTEAAKRAGMAIPTAVTAAVWECFVRVPDAVRWQSEDGRLWEVLWALRCEVAQGAAATEVRYTVMVDNDGLGPMPVELLAKCSDDDGQPVSTIMLPGEG